MPTAKKRKISSRNTTRKTGKMNDLIQLINHDFQEVLRGRKDPTQHLFFENIIWWKKTYKEWASKDYFTQVAMDKMSFPEKYNYNPKADLSLITPYMECNFIPKKTLSKSYIEEFYTLLTTPGTKYSQVQQKCKEMTEYNLPATVTSTASWKTHKDPNAMNIVVLGAGPVGLFTALFLNQYYNKKVHWKEFSLRKVNVLLVENRIKEEGVKLPYSRSTQLSFDVSEIQQLLRFIFCWGADVSQDDARMFDYIYMFENMLYTTAYHAQIPMLFTKKFDEYKTLEDFVKTQDIHVVFDCTGGRTKIPAKVPKTLHWDQYPFKKGDQEIKLNKETKYYEYCEKGEPYKKPTYRLQIFDKHNKEYLTGNVLLEPTNNDDVVLATKYNNQCLLTDDYIRLSSAFKQSYMRQLFPFLIKETHIPLNKIHHVKLGLYNTLARHSPFAATKLTKDTLLIRLGDALGSTEYGMTLGTKHSIELSHHICQLLSSFL